MELGGAYLGEAYLGGDEELAPKEPEGGGEEGGGEEGGKEPAPPVLHYRPLTPLALEFLGQLPPILRESADYQAVMQATAKECELALEAIEQVREQFNPATAGLLLGVWERITRQTVQPAGVPLDERREAVVARLRRMIAAEVGSDWEGEVTAIIGAGWSYSEHIPGDLTTPPENTLRIELPFGAEDARYQEALRLIPEVTPAHLEVEFSALGGFLLDLSEMDIGELSV